MQFFTFAQLLDKIEQTTKRLEITAYLVDLYQQLSPEEIKPVCYLLQGQLVPSYESKEFQISTKMLLRVLSRLKTAASPAEVTQAYKTVGDLGTFTEQVLTATPNHSLQEFTILEIFQKLWQIADEAGAGSQERKVQLSLDLLSQLDPVSAKYVVRIILGKMRLGFSDMTMIDALSWTVAGDKSLSGAIEKAYQKRADIGYIASVVLTTQGRELDKVELAVGTPVIPALCQRLNSAAEIITKMKEVIAEPKYDGTRVQIHFQRQGDGIEVKSFTRNLEESSHMFPELHTLGEVLHCQSCILDCEAVGYDPTSQQMLTFQHTIQRKRKHQVSEKASQIPLRFYVFDILAKDGRSLLAEPLLVRKKILQETVRPSETFVITETLQTTDPVKLHQYHEQQLAAGLEGVVIKKVDGHYQSGRKQFSWVKIKEAEGKQGKLNDTVDAVVMGYYFGEGKNQQYGVGALLVGLLKEDGVFVTVSKVGSGLSESSSREFVQRAEKLKIAEKPKEYEVITQLIPDVWLAPQLVIEIAADEVTTSPSHSSGYALRFPRFLRFRDDKTAEQATTLEELQTITHL